MKLCGPSTISVKKRPQAGGNARPSRSAGCFSDFSQRLCFALSWAIAVFSLGACSAGSPLPNPPPASATRPAAAQGPASPAASRAALARLQPGSALNVLSGEEQSALDPALASAGGCRSSQPLGASLAELARNARQSEEANYQQTDFSDTFLDWLFGGGLGRTALNVGTVVVFPPYALYMLGNAGIALAGYDPLYITDVLPAGTRTPVLSAYDELTSVPGRLNAAVLREQFCSPLKPAAVLPEASEHSKESDGGIK